MAQEYISYIQTENLLRNWTTIQGMKESLQIELTKLEKTNAEGKDEYILSQVLGNRVLSDTPPSGKISDTTGNVATSYKKILNQDYYTTLEEIRKDKYYVDIVDDKLNIAFKRLPRTQGRILKLFYLECKTWAEVLDELKSDKCYFTKQQAQRRRREGIYKIQSISKITTDDYNHVIKLVEVE